MTNTSAYCCYVNRDPTYQITFLSPLSQLERTRTNMMNFKMADKKIIPVLRQIGALKFKCPGQRNSQGTTTPTDDTADRGQGQRPDFSLRSF